MSETGRNQKNFLFGCAALDNQLPPHGGHLMGDTPGEVAESRGMRWGCLPYPPLYAAAAGCQGTQKIFLIAVYDEPPCQKPRCSTNPNRFQSAFARLKTDYRIKVEIRSAVVVLRIYFPHVKGKYINSPSRRRLSLISTASRSVIATLLPIAQNDPHNRSPP